jgi:hypothetical protein
MHLHKDRGGPGLYVSVYFHDRPSLNKRDTLPLANEIADAILRISTPRSVSDPYVEIPWNVRPEQIAAITVQASIDGEDRLWQPAGGGLVAQISADEIIEIVQKKSIHAPQARRKCDELWLVIVNDLFSRAAPAEISSEAIHAKYEAPFDRLLWLIHHVPTAIDLRRI